MTAEIRYSEESTPGPGASRILFADGKWLVPPKQRPKDWRKYEQPAPCIEKARDVAVVPRESQTVEAKTIRQFPLNAKSKANAARRKGGAL
jgi:hypothetical protein